MIPWAAPTLVGREDEYVREALASSWISGGPFVDRLESGFSSLLRTPFASAVSNGTAALHLAYLALGIGHDDEIIVPGFAYMGAANVALLCGARPVFAEVDPETWCLDAASVQKVITPRTKAIVPVHTYGNVCDMAAILEIALQAQIPVIEDAAEALMSRWQGSPAGTLGILGTYSFHATKTITTGEGGMVVTTNPDLHERIRLFRSHGMSRERRYYWHEVPGHNFRLSNLQAAMGCAQLERIDQIIEQRKKVHALYCAELQAASALALQHFNSQVDPVLWAMAVELDSEAYPQGRDQVIVGMREAGFECRPGFYSACEQPIYAAQSLPICIRLAQQVISVPTYPGLTPEQIHAICQKLLRLRR